MENMNNEIIETTEIETTGVDYIDVDYDETVVEKGNGGKLLLVGGLVVAGAAAIVATQGKKIKKWHEDRTLAKAEKIMAKRELEAADEDYVEEEIVDAEVIDAEETEE